MKRQAGWLTVAAAIAAAVFGIARLSPRAPSLSAGEPAQVQKTAAKEKSAKETSPSKPHFACGEIAARLERFIQLGVGQFPDSCVELSSRPKPKTQALTPQGEFRFLIATLPDPVHTHFSLQFD